MLVRRVAALLRLGLAVKAEPQLFSNVVGIEQLVVEDRGGVGVDEHPLRLQHLIALLRAGNYGEAQVDAHLPARLDRLLARDSKAGALRHALGLDYSPDCRRRVLADRK